MKKTLKTLAGDEIVRYLTKKKVSLKCESCGHGEWFAPDPQKEGLTEIPVSLNDGAVRIPSPTVPVCLLICKNCSYIRQYAAIMILEDLNRGGD